MRHLAKLLCLLAALAGTPLRQAEAADDLARALAKLLEPAHIETPDGRVGDDSGVGTLERANQIMSSPENEPLSRAIDSLPILNSSQFAEHHALRWRNRAAWPPCPLGRDRAWLGVFLF